MTWNELDHPRDDEGKFTYKGGGLSSNIVLEGKVEKNVPKDSSEESSFPETTKKEMEIKYRNKLLDILGDKTQREEILYSTVPELENKIISYSVNNINKIKDKLTNTISKLKNSGFSYNSVCQKILNKAELWDNALGDFARNYNDMVEANTINADKYFHAKANCQAAQRGLGGEIISNILSTSRELEEGTRKIIFEGEDIFKQINDANEDMKANSYGRMLGKNNEIIKCKILLNDKRPNGLDDKY